MSESNSEAYERALQLQREGRLAEAEVILRELARVDLRVRVAFTLGVNLWMRGEYAEAETWTLLAARHAPHDSGIRLGLARVYQAQGRLEQAELEMRTAGLFAPNDPLGPFELGALLLSMGRYSEGWPLLEHRTAVAPKLVPPINLSFPEWRGEPLAGKSILIWYEQGFGDQIQMARFAQSLKARGATHVALGCRPPLAHLFSTLTAADEIVEAPKGAVVSIRPYDYWTRYFSAPQHLGITLENLPTQPYLSAPPDRRERWRGYSGVGLAWRASATGRNGAKKSLKPEEAARFLDLGAVSLDPEATGVSDFADTAAIIEQLDLVISIDTSVAHLAGAMGKPVWTMLPAVITDWRWLRDRTDSPWYPGMRLYRQTTPEDWNPVIDQVLRDLGARTGQPLGRGPVPVSAG